MTNFVYESDIDMYCVECIYRNIPICTKCHSLVTKCFERIDSTRFKCEPNISYLSASTLHSEYRRRKEHNYIKWRAEKHKCFKEANEKYHGLLSKL